MSASQPKLLDLVRAALRCRHYSLRTETAYLDWIKRYIRFHGKRHPKELGAEAIAAFLTHLAVDRQVAAATQNQALNGLLFLYRVVLHEPMDQPWGFVRAKEPQRLPVVFTREEIQLLFAHLNGLPRLEAMVPACGHWNQPCTARSSRCACSMKKTWQ